MNPYSNDEALKIETFLGFLKSKSIRKKTVNQIKKRPVRLAVLGSYSTQPLVDLLEHFMWAYGYETTIQEASFDSAHTEAFSESSTGLLEDIDATVFLPSRSWMKFDLFQSSREEVESFVESTVRDLLAVVEAISEKSKRPILLANFMLPKERDPGPIRSKVPGSLWNVAKSINQKIGQLCGANIHICDLEYLSCRVGLQNVWDYKSYFESKQLAHADFMTLVAKEFAYIFDRLKTPQKKVLVTDLDNTLWGGVIGDDGLRGIELGQNSAAGQAYLELQFFIKKLLGRGVLLTVASKNELSTAMEAIDKHPEMLLRESDLAAVKINWNPKPDNISLMANELSLGLDSFVFIDDNPAETLAVQQFLPEVNCLTLTMDVSEFASRLSDQNWFEPLSLTDEDKKRSLQYHQEKERRVLKNSVTDLKSYLTSLEMVGRFETISDKNLQRVGQLINKSNQFNLTTRRKTEAEIHSLEKHSLNFAVRLRDRFGDYGLISVVLGSMVDGALEIETWVMSCRVLGRQVEELILNEVVRRALENKINSLKGVFIPTAKNALVKNLYTKLGFIEEDLREDGQVFSIDLNKYQFRHTEIRIEYE